MSVLENALAHANDAPDIVVPVPEWKTTFYYRGHLSMKDYSRAIKAVNDMAFEPLCDLLVKYAQTEDGKQVFSGQDDAYKLKKGADPNIIVRAFTPAMRPPESVETTVKN